MEEKVLSIVAKMNSYLTDYILIFLLVGVGLWFSIKTRFVQVRCFKEGMKKTFGGLSLRGGKNKSGMSSFQALATAVAAQVGTGNIVGASGAIITGGPGAIFWMWIIAFFGMATIYAEATLAQETRVIKDDGTVLGGPVYYIKKAFTGKFGKFLAVFFAIAITLALGFMGSMVQSNSIAGACKNAFGIEPWVVGAVVALVAAFIFLGGVQRIASVTEKLVPIMALFFFVGGVTILGFRVRYIPETFAMIFKYAFTPQALLGGGIGAALKTAVSQGAKRGLFSNEAGMGSTPHAHAMANVKNPHEQGVVAMIGVFIDTFVVLTITALVVISSLYAGNGNLATADEYISDSDNRAAYVQTYAESNPTLSEAEVQADTDAIFEDIEKGMINDDTAAVLNINKNNAMQISFSNIMGNSGSMFIAICLLFFAFSTIISWNFFGKLNVQYLFGSKNRAATIIYSIVAIGFIFLGSILENALVWELTDFFNYLMVLPNVIALLALSKIVVNISKNKKND